MRQIVEVGGEILKCFVLVHRKSGQVKKGAASIFVLGKLGIPGFDVNRFADLQARIAATIAVVEGIAPESLEGSMDRTIVLPSPRGEMTFQGRDFLFDFILANLHFHCTMTYALLRGAGVELGKSDYIPPRG